jgi:tRNA pseudouridine32 synthase/23S rRNA pseudouridine746 synthase
MLTKILPVYKNDDFIVIDKPSGISFHNQQDIPGIHTLLKAQLRDNIWPVHRLDKMTSGLLIFAKSQHAAAELGKMFEQRKIKKNYIALSDKKPKKKQGKIIGDMKKSRRGSWKLCQSKENPATTHFQSRSLLPGIRLYWITPTTGKTHQIRVALKSIGAPILGDQRYSGSNADRGYLHAYQLNFIWRDEVINLDCCPNFGKYFVLNEMTNLLKEFSSSDINPAPQTE